MPLAVKIFVGAGDFDLLLGHVVVNSEAEFLCALVVFVFDAIPVAGAVIGRNDTLVEQVAVLVNSGRIHPEFNGE